MPVAKSILSGSTNNKLIVVSGTSTGAAVTIHTTDSSNKEEVWLYAYNGHTADIKLTIEWGGTTVPDDLIEITIPYKAGLVKIVPGLILTNSLIIKAWASGANYIYICGYTHDIGAANQTVTKQIFSGRANGLLVKPTATSSPGTVIHTAHASALDEIWAYANNYTASNKEITVEWGNTSFKQTIISESGPQIILPGIPLTGSEILKVYSNPASVTIGGFLNRWT